MAEREKSMKRLKKRQEKELIKIIEAIKAYAEKYDENYLSFSCCGGAVSVNNDPNNKKRYYDFVLFEDGKLIFDIAGEYYIIKEGKTA